MAGVGDLILDLNGPGLFAAGLVVERLVAAGREAVVFAGAGLPVCLAGADFTAAAFTGDLMDRSVGRTRGGGKGALPCLRHTQTPPM